MNSPKEYDELLETIYQAALGESDWLQTINSINQIFDSTVGGFFIQDDEKSEFGEVLMTGLPDSSIQLYDEHFSALNPWFAIPGMMDPNCIRTEEDVDIYHRKKGSFHSTEYYNDWMAKLDVKHAIGGSLTTRGPWHLNFTMFRPSAAGGYTKNEIQSVLKISPHLKRALEVSSLVTEAKRKHAMLLNGMDDIGFGVVAFNEFNKIAEMNKTAEAILMSNDGLSSINQSISIKCKKSAEQFEAILNASTKFSTRLRCAASEWLHIPRLSDKANYQMMLIQSTDPVNHFHGGSVSTLLLIVDPAQKIQLPRGQIQQRYSLTERETDVAQHLLSGMAAKEIAVELDLTYESTRWYIKQVCQKTGTRKQTEFIAKVLGEFSLFICTLNK